MALNFRGVFSQKGISTFTKVKDLITSYNPKNHNHQHIVMQYLSISRQFNQAQHV